MERWEVEAGKSAKGGFTRKQLAEWGVPWPPPKGWRRRLEGREPRVKRKMLTRAGHPDNPNFTTEAYRREHETGEFSEWMTPEQREVAAEAYRRMVP